MNNEPLIITSYALSEIMDQVTTHCGSEGRKFVNEIRKDVQAAYDSGVSFDIEHLASSVTCREFWEFQAKLKDLNVKRPLGYRFMMDSVLDKAMDRSFRLMK